MAKIDYQTERELRKLRRQASAIDADLQAELDLKQDLLVSGTNIKTIDGASILGSGNIVTGGGGYTDEQAQDAVGAMVGSSLEYVDATPLLRRAALTGAITAATGSNTTALGSFTKAQLDTAVSDGNVQYVGDAPTAHTHLLAAGATDVTITAANLNTLDDGVNSALHFHDTDRARANHTGTQLASTVSDFAEAVDDRVAALLVAGTNITLTYNDVANTLTVDAAGGGGYTDEMAQDAIGAMLGSTLEYVDATPLLRRAALTGAITAAAGSNTTALGSFTKAQLDTAVSDGNIRYVGDAVAQADVTNLVSDLAAKQATLVSGTNIKTVKGVSLLGAGDVAISETNEVRPDQFAGIPTVQLDSAINYLDGGTVIVRTPDDTTALPASYIKSAIMYLARRAGYWYHTATSFGRSEITFKSQHSTHATDAEVTLHVETQSKGSTANGPDKADYSGSFAIHKEGYAGGAAVSGEIDGLTVNVRQDGPDGLPPGDPGSSDAAGILLNVQNVGTAGFVAAIEATTSNLTRGGGFPVAKGIQSAQGVINANASPVLSYGFTAVSTTGTNNHAFYAGEDGGTWTNILEAPNKVRITSAGDYLAPTATWTSGAWSASRVAGTNGALTIQNRGTGGLLINSQEAGEVLFATTGTVRAKFAATGSFLPNTNLGNNIGDQAQRWSTIHGYQIDLGTSTADEVTINTGAGSPEGSLTATPGSVYLRSGGGVGTSLYVKESGTGNTGWFSRSHRDNLSGKKEAKWNAVGNSTAITAEGAAALTAAGTATARNWATTNRATRIRMVEWLVTVAATTAIASFREAAAKWTIGDTSQADMGGFFYSCTWGTATGGATATHRAFVGMANTVAAPTDVEPSTITNIVGMGWDSADTNVQIMHRGVGAITKVDLGASFPVPSSDRANAYTLELFSPPGTTQRVDWRVLNITGNVEATGTISTNMPVATLALAPRGWMSVGGTSSVIGIALSQLYLQSDY